MVQEGQTFLYPGMSDNHEVQIEGVGSGESGELGAMAGEGEVRLSKSIQGDRIIDTAELRQRVDPQEIQWRRSDAARTADRAKDAELTTDPLEWASDPAAHDFPGVDTGPKFREVEGENYDTDGLIDFQW